VPVSAFALLIVAALLHTWWNLLVKRADEKRIFTWWSLIVGSVCLLPLLAVYPSIPAQAWGFVVASAVAEAAYFIALTWAYAQSDFSVVYPLARGLAPALLAIWATVFLGEHLQGAGIAGLCAVILGILLVSSTGFWQRTEAVGVAGLGAAVLVALCISIYSAIDAAAIRIIHPITYSVLISIVTALFVAPFVLLRYPAATIRQEWYRNWLPISVVGIASALTYLLVLQAYDLARASYVGAVREISVVLAAIVGTVWLGESWGALRIAGAVCIFCGILVIAIAG
jgi:drug/metabolite transporter (DMT)-like permease